MLKLLKRVIHYKQQSACKVVVEKQSGLVMVCLEHNRRTSRLTGCLCKAGFYWIAPVHWSCQPRTSWNLVCYFVIILPDKCLTLCSKVQSLPKLVQNLLNPECPLSPLIRILFLTLK